MALPQNQNQSIMGLLGNNAEVTLIKGSSDTQVLLVPKRGTSGMIAIMGDIQYVPDSGIAMNLSDPIFTYADESVDLADLPFNTGRLWLYLADSSDLWQDVLGYDLRLKLVAFDTAPTTDRRYLGQTSLGIHARYVGLMSFDLDEELEPVIGGDYNLAGAFDTTHKAWKLGPPWKQYGVAAPAGTTLLAHTYVRAESAPAGSYIRYEPNFLYFGGSQAERAGHIYARNPGTTAGTVRASGLGILVADEDLGCYVDSTYAVMLPSGTIDDYFTVIQRILPIV